MRLCLAGLLAVFMTVGCQQKTLTEQAVEEVERLGGAVRRDGRLPGTPVTTVSLAGSRVTDGELRVVKAFPSLRALDLRLTRITDKGLAHLEHLTTLQQLYLDSTRITDAGLAHLEGLPELRKLSLSNTEVTDLGLGFLAKVHSLEDLIVRHTEVTDKGAEQLREALPKVHITR